MGLKQIDVLLSKWVVEHHFASLIVNYICITGTSSRNDNTPCLCCKTSLFATVLFIFRFWPLVSFSVDPAPIRRIYMTLPFSSSSQVPVADEKYMSWTPLKYPDISVVIYLVSFHAYICHILFTYRVRIPICSCKMPQTIIIFNLLVFTCLVSAKG